MSLYRFIAAEKADYPVSLLCRALGVSRSGLYAWERRPPCQRALRDEWLVERIRRIHADSNGTYGSPRVHAQLRREGIRVGRTRVERLMRDRALEGVPRPRRRKGTTIRVRGVRPAPDLVGRDFRARRPNQLWFADIREIATGEGKLYLAAVIDCFSRACVGWSMAAHMRGTLVRHALEHAVERRRPGHGLIHHSDRGSLGGFKWSSQHLDGEELRWENRGGVGPIGRGGRRCVRRGGRRWRGVRIASGSGRRSPTGSRASGPACSPVCRPRLASGGFVRVAACRRSAGRRCRGASCRSASARRSRS